MRHGHQSSWRTARFTLQRGGAECGRRGGNVNGAFHEICEWCGRGHRWRDGHARKIDCSTHDSSHTSARRKESTSRREYSGGVDTCDASGSAKRRCMRPRTGLVATARVWRPPYKPSHRSIHEFYARPPKLLWRRYGKVFCRQSEYFSKPKSRRHSCCRKSHFRTNSAGTIIYDSARSDTNRVEIEN